MSSLRAHCGWLLACLSQCVVGWLVWFGLVGSSVGYCLPACLFACVGTYYIKEVRARLKNTIPVDPVRSSESDVLQHRPVRVPLLRVYNCVKLSRGFIIDIDNSNNNKNKKEHSSFWFLIFFVSHERKRNMGVAMTFPLRFT